MESDSAASFANAMEARLWSVASNKFGVQAPPAVAAVITALALVPEKPSRRRKRRKPADHTCSQPLVPFATNSKDCGLSMPVHSCSQPLLDSPVATSAKFFDDFTSPVANSHIKILTESQTQNFLMKSNDVFESDSEEKMHQNHFFAVPDLENWSKSEFDDGDENFLFSPTPQKKRNLAVEVEENILFKLSDDERNDFFDESTNFDYLTRNPANFDDLSQFVSDDEGDRENFPQIENKLKRVENSGFLGIVKNSAEFEAQNFGSLKIGNKMEELNNSGFLGSGKNFGEAKFGKKFEKTEDLFYFMEETEENDELNDAQKQLENAILGLI